MNLPVLQLDGKSLGLNDLRAFDANSVSVALAGKARQKMQTSVECVRKVIDKKQICYGINTGFGALAGKRIEPEQVRDLQYNLVRSHACGVGEPLSDKLVCRVIILKANSLAMGYSGIRPEIVDTLLALLNANILPVIPGKGSVGASGDLAPLAHLALALIGEGEARKDGRLLKGKDVLAAADLEPVELQAKEGLALLNGTQLSAALAIEGLFRSETLLASSIVSGALSTEGLAGSYSPFDARMQEVRNLTGQQDVAAAFRSLLTESAIHSSHGDCNRVQDPYSLRCMPQVLGAVRDTLHHASSQLARECNSVTDNPLIFDERVISGGNFHAEALAFVADFMTIAVCEIANIAERRIDLLLRMVNPGLQMFLAANPGVESGFMIAHVSAAALCSENKTLAHPASVDTVPTSAGQEDHVSMAPWAGHKLLQVTENTAQILGIELMVAAAAIDAQAPLATTPELNKVLTRVRKTVEPQAADRRLDKEMAAIKQELLRGDFAKLLPGNNPLQF
ncbi:MAG: histidine ammonia-lyase [Gammaproteobacteria bacterium]